MRDLVEGQSVGDDEDVSGDTHTGHLFELLAPTAKQGLRVSAISAATVSSVLLALVTYLL